LFFQLRKMLSCFFSVVIAIVFASNANANQVQETQPYPTQVHVAYPPCVRLNVIAVRRGFNAQADPRCAPAQDLPFGVQASTQVYNRITRQLEPPSPNITCSNGQSADVCVYFTPGFPFNGFWSVPIVHDPKRCSGQPPAYLAHYCPQDMHAYRIAYAGSAAKAGDACFGSPGTIGAFLNAHPPYTHIHNITEVVDDTSFNTSRAGYVSLGWVYIDENGQQWFQGTTGANVGVSAGVLTFGISGANVVAPINPIAGDIFNLLVNVQIAVSKFTNGGVVHSRACFTKGWDGKS